MLIYMGETRPRRSVWKQTNFVLSILFETINFDRYEYYWNLTTVFNWTNVLFCGCLLVCAKGKIKIKTVFQS